MNIDIKLKLSVQRALLGAIPSGLRAVSIEAKDSVIFLRSIFDSEKAKNENWETLSMVGTEIISDFPNFKISEEFITLSGTTKDMNHLKNLVFMRQETFFD